MQYSSFPSPQQHSPRFPLMTLYHSLCTARTHAFYFFALINTRLVSTFLVTSCSVLQPTAELSKARCCFLNCRTHTRRTPTGFVNSHSNTSLERITPTYAWEQAVTSLSGRLLPTSTTTTCSTSTTARTILDQL